MKKFTLATLTLLLSASVLRAQIDVEQALAIGRNAIYFNDYIVSMGYFNQIIGLRPWMAEPYFYRAVAKINLDDYAGAESDASLALERNPIYPRAYLLRGIARFSQKEYPASIEDFRRGLELSPRDVGLQYNLAIALLQDKKYVEADSAARRLVTIDPKNKDAFRILAQSALERKDTIRASRQVDELLAKDSTYIPAHLLRAQIAAEKKDYRTSIRSLDQVLAQDAGDANLYINRAIMRYHLNDLRGAMSDYTEGLRLEPNDRAALNNRALLRTQVGEYSLAIEDWDKLLQLEPEHYIARYNRALLALRLGQLRSALEDLNKVLKRYPIFAEGFIARSEVYRKLGDIKAATRDELHLFDLQHSKSYRNRAASASRTPNKVGKETRSREDEAIEKYNMLVETAPEPVKDKPRYTSQIRGRIQDQEAQMTPRRDLLLSYFTEIDKDGNQGQVYFAPLLDALNTRYLQQDKKALRLVLREQGSSLSQTELEQVQRHLTQLTSRATPSLLQTFQKGVDYMLLQDLSAAIATFTEVIERDSSFTLAYFARSVASLRRSEAERAHPAEPSASPVPSTPQVRAAAIGGKSASIPEPALPRPVGRVIEYSPLSDLDQVIAQAPTFAFAYYNRANLYVKSGDVARAKEDYTKAISLNPLFAESFFNRGLLFYSEGKVKEGTKDLSRAGELGLYKAYSLIKRMNK